MPSSGLIVCEHCGVPRPQSQFRWRKAGVSRHSDCNSCHARSETKRMSFKRQARRDRLIGRTVRAISQSDDLVDVRRLVLLLLDRLGGPRQLARNLTEVLDSAKSRPAIVAHSMLAVMKLKLLVEAHPAPIETPAMLEGRRAMLRREFSDFLVKQVHERPEELAELLRAAGWQVERPETSRHDSFLAATQE